MNFAGFQKLTLLDYPGKTACILFTKGCNMRCPFCHNSSLALGNCETPITDTEVFAFLKKRQGILEGVVISGGEPLLHKEIVTFIKEVKNLGYSVKLDTNGTNPALLKQLVTDGLVDYVAMDIKNSFEKYNITSGCDVDIQKIKQSIDFLLEDNADYEFRTTVVKNFHDINDIENIGKIIKGAKRYFLQSFLDSRDILCENMQAVDKNLLENFLKTAQKYVADAQIRGL